MPCDSLINKLKSKLLEQNDQTLRHAMTLAQEAELKLKKNEGFKDTDLSVMQISSIPQSESVVMDIQGQSIQIVNQVKLQVHLD